MENPAEVQEVRNKLRMMKFPQDEILSIVRRQQRAIHKQKQANDTIRNEINEYETQIGNIDRAIHQYKTSEELQKLQTQKKNLTNKLSIISADYNAEETKRRRLEDEVSKANSRAGGFFQQSRENAELQARLRTMENRLDKALVRYNRNLAKLADMRARIDELRKDRFTFRDVIRNAEIQREKTDQEINNLISTSNEAYSERDRRKMELVRLKTAEKADVKAFEEKLARLNQTIEGQKIAQSHPMNQHAPLPPTNSQIGSQSDQQEELTQLTEQYQVTIQRTLDLLSMQDVPELFSEAEKLERENFSLYNFVVEHGATRTRLCEEIEGLELQKNALLAQADTSEVQQSEQLEHLTSDIQEVDKELAEITAKKEQNEEEFSSVYSEIESIFNMLNCSWADAPDGKATITSSNAMFCLSLIETAIADMVNMIYEKTKLECNLRDVVPSSFLHEDPTMSQGVVVSRHMGQTRAAQEKELAGRVADTTKPLSIEEMMAMLD